MHTSGMTVEYEKKGDQSLTYRHDEAALLSIVRFLSYATITTFLQRYPPGFQISTRREKGGNWARGERARHRKFRRIGRCWKKWMAVAAAGSWKVTSCGSTAWSCGEVRCMQDRTILLILSFVNPPKKAPQQVGIKRNQQCMVQRDRKRFVNLAKQEPGRTRQSN